MSDRARRALAAACAVAFVGQPGEATADPEIHACIESANKGQVLRDKGALTEAQASFLRCSNTNACPTLVTIDCRRWFTEVSAILPTVVTAARDAEGHDILPARVALDGKTITEHGGKAVAVDPGSHVFRFEAPGKMATEESVIIREGEKARIVRVLMMPSEQSSPSSAPAPKLLPTFLLGGAGVAALGSFAVFGLMAQSDKDHLAGTCAPSRTCSEDDVGAVRSKIVIADVSLGVGAVLVGLATFTLLRALSPPPAEATTN